jgi:hypothetical protein
MGTFLIPYRRASAPTPAENCFFFPASVAPLVVRQITGPHGRALRGVALWTRRPTLLDSGIAITSSTPPPRKQRRGAVFIKKKKKTGGVLAAFSSPAQSLQYWEEGNRPNWDWDFSVHGLTRRGSPIATKVWAHPIATEVCGTRWIERPSTDSEIITSTSETKWPVTVFQAQSYCFFFRTGNTIPLKMSGIRKSTKLIF